MIQHYLATWQAERVLLIGYSFGADVLPFIWNRLPAPLQERVDSMSLLGPGATASFEIKVAGWLPGADEDGRATLPELRLIDKLPLLCAYGSGEEDSLCPKLQLTNVSTVMIGSRHHFSGQTASIADAILRVADGGKTLH